MAPFAAKKHFSEMVWHLIGVYVINRTLHDRLEIRNFSSRVGKYFTCSLRSAREIFFNTRRESSYVRAQYPPCITKTAKLRY